MKSLPILAFEGLRGFQAFNRVVILTLLMLPQYRNQKAQDLLSAIALMPEADQRKVIREALSFVDIDRMEVDYLICLIADPNGVPYSRNSINKLSVKELLDILVEACFNFAQI